MPELDDDVVPAFRSVYDLREAALAREGARGTPTDRLVDHGDGDEVLREAAPAVGVAVVATAVRHGGVAAEVQGGRAGGSGGRGGGIGWAATVAGDALRIPW